MPWTRSSSNCKRARRWCQNGGCICWGTSKFLQLCSENAFHWIMSPNSHCGQCSRESGGHMMINLPVFKDEDKKDAVTYQSWHWDLMLYHPTGCWDHILLPYVICFLQGFPGELVRSLGTHITLYGILAIQDEHYNNVKALDALNQELFQL